MSTVRMVHDGLSRYALMPGFRPEEIDSLDWVILVLRSRGVKYADIAAAVHLSSTTVQKRFYRAVGRLADAGFGIPTETGRNISVHSGVTEEAPDWAWEELIQFFRDSE